MNSLSTVKLGIAKKLKDKGYRHRFFKRRAQGEIATQIRELRRKREITQKHLAEAMNTGQSAIARIEDAKYAGWSFETLLRVAETLDARFRVIFEPMEDVITEYERREKREVDNELAGTEAGEFPDRPRALQGIAASGQSAKKEASLLKSLGALSFFEAATLENAEVYVAVKAGQARANAAANIFGHKSDETDSDRVFAGL